MKLYEITPEKLKQLQEFSIKNCLSLPNFGQKTHHKQIEIFHKILQSATTQLRIMSGDIVQPNIVLTSPEIAGWMRMYFEGHFNAGIALADVGGPLDLCDRGILINKWEIYSSTYIKSNQLMLLTRVESGHILQGDTFTAHIKFKDWMTGW